MKKRMRIMLAVSLAVLLLGTTSVFGQSAPPASAGPESSDNQWRFLVAPYLWAVSVDSKVIVGNYSAKSTMTFSDIINHAQGAGQVHMEARKGDIGFFFDATYLKLREDETVTAPRNGATPLPARDVTFTSEMWLVELGMFYQVGKWSLGGKKSASVDLLAGGRYWYTRSSLDTTSSVSPSKTDDFIDPIVGAQATVDLTEKLVMNVRGDIGGFGVGSDFSWNALGLFGYRITPSITAGLGYRALYLDYKPSTSHTRINMTMHGPMAGIAFLF